MAKIFASQMSSLEQFFKPTVIVTPSSQLPAGSNRPHIVSHRCRPRNCSLSINERKQAEDCLVPSAQGGQPYCPEFIILGLRLSKPFDFNLHSSHEG